MTQRRIFLVIIQLMSIVINNLCMIIRKPLDVFLIIATLSFKKSFELTPHHSRDIIHRKSTLPNSIKFNSDIASGATIAA